MVEIEQTKRCPGCGQVMQDHDPTQSNYVLSLDFKLCMRCFRWRHYKDLPMLINPIINVNEPHMPAMPEHDALLLVVDGFMLDETLLPLLPWIDKAKEVSIVITKLDLFPKQVTSASIQAYVTTRLEQLNVRVDHVFVTSMKYRFSLEPLRKYVLTKPNDYRLLVLGMINAGKSSLLNALMKQPELTTSPFPQTTLDPIINQFEHVTLIDMPGFSNPDHLFYHIDPSLYQKVMPTTTIKPKVFQLKGDQSIFIDPLIVIHIQSKQPVGVSVYASDALSITRKKFNEATKQLLEIDSIKKTPLKVTEQGIDFVIEGVAKVHLVGSVESLVVVHHPRLTVKKSKGTLLW